MELGSAFITHITVCSRRLTASLFYCWDIPPSVLACSMHLGDKGLQKIGVGLFGLQVLHPTYGRAQERISQDLNDMHGLLRAAFYRIGDFLAIYNSILSFVPLLIAG